MKTTHPNYKYKTALIIDDNELDNFINENMLKGTWFSKHIHISTNGKKALDYINGLIVSPTGNAAYPDIIFVDLNMPVMNGFEFIEGFKKINNKQLPACRVVILTSSVSSEDRLKADKIDKGIAFVNKPLTNEILNSL